MCWTDTVFQRIAVTFRKSVRRKHVYVFLTALFFASVFAFKEHLWMPRSGAMTNNVFRVVFSNRRPATSYDPAKIQYASEYCFLQNVYSPLVEYSPKGEIVSAVAESFQWIGTNAYFKIRKGLRTADGQEIDAHDVAVSFKRLFILGGNTHGDLKHMLCPGVKLSGLDDYCPGIAVSQDGSEFILKFKEKKLFLFSMLAAMDFAVIPRNAVDPKTLKITDFRNTSGPYYVSKDDAAGGLELSANTSHFHYSENIPRNLLFIVPKTSDATEPLEMFSKEEADHLTTKDPSYWMKIRYAREHNDAELHLTFPLNLHALVFTKKGRGRFSKDERIIIAGKLKKMFLEHYLTRPGFEAADQIIPAFGEGGLSSAQISRLNKSSAIDDERPFPKAFVCWNFFGVADSKLQEQFPKGKFLWVGSVPDFKTKTDSKNDEPDCYLFRGDTGFQEDVGFMFYYFGLDFFDIEDADKKAWLDKYLATASKNERMEMLQTLHFQTIRNAKVFPVALESYSAIVRKPWKFSFSKYHANNPIWRIHR